MLILAYHRRSTRTRIGNRVAFHCHDNAWRGNVTGRLWGTLRTVLRLLKYHRSSFEKLIHSEKGIDLPSILRFMTKSADACVHTTSCWQKAVEKRRIILSYRDQPKGLDGIIGASPLLITLPYDSDLRNPPRVQGSRELRGWRGENANGARCLLEAWLA